MNLRTADPLPACYQKDALHPGRGREKRSEQGAMYAHQARAHDKRIRKNQENERPAAVDQAIPNCASAGVPAYLALSSGKCE
jgi:hypothetical protein